MRVPCAILAAIACNLFQSVDAFAPNPLKTVSSNINGKASLGRVLSVAASEEITATGTDNIVTPKGALNQWEVHKFGGASLATAELYKTVGDLLISEAAGRGDPPRLSPNCRRRAGARGGPRGGRRVGPRPARAGDLARPGGPVQDGRRQLQGQVHREAEVQEGQEDRQERVHLHAGVETAEACRG